MNPRKADLQSAASPLGYPGILLKEVFWRRGGDLNPGGTTPIGLAGRRHTRLGYRGTFNIKEFGRVFKSFANGNAEDRYKYSSSLFKTDGAL